ncbi:LacI family transcriptional regulator [Arcticibacter pallidicorallinus]|uniref:LacI family transcriptional regulator n=1 Tax=Arcticibacter pallidicorallinus TaxID=1259464 RepID=A0A2T0UC18_9SPHI|nr:LacI family DNA-binding transcriptional regulator [Arcticibacter pallidicorallinus]PRY55418.1 LacI family transcriptional regulator [Arcticibacter pallidicorallinus]
MDSINIKQLAEKLNLSTSTVSRAFRGHNDINKETKERILAMARELNYQPNHLASNLRENKSKTIAVVVPEIANNFFSRAINGIERMARDKGYHVLIYLTNDDFDKEVEFLSELHNGRVDGIIMSVTGEAKDHSYMHKIRKKSIPLVFFDRVYDDVVASKVLTNDYESSFTATKHLLEKGCKKIVYLVVNKNLSIGKMRMQGYCDALESSGIKFSEDLVIDCSNDMSSNMELLGQVFQTVKPDGVFASVERLALASYYVCHDLGIRIGQDLKIICFSSLEIAPLLNPSLSTITQPAFDMGGEAARILFRRLEDANPDEHENVVLASELIIRNSSL